jgi:antitoxin (DNA-binding transcriptional repressor) of toxin-antitoxin stability system
MSAQHITLTPEQANVVRDSNATIEVRDQEGRTVAHLTPLTQDDLDAIERYRRSRGKPMTSIPAAEVEAHMRRLAEIEQMEGLDETKMLDLLRRMRAGERV